MRYSKKILPNEFVSAYLALASSAEDERVCAGAAMAILDRARSARPDIMAAIREIARGE